MLSQLLLDNSREGRVNRLLAGILLIKEEVQGGVTADEGGSESVLLLDQNIQQVGLVIVLGVRSDYDNISHFVLVLFLKMPQFSVVTL